jgi:hypothetical protein
VNIDPLLPKAIIVNYVTPFSQVTL